jgi:trimethylamine--corrinoid protein Co-methyltransferase
MLQGVPVTPDTLAVDVIAQVRPGGHFISTEHTLRHFRQVLWQPELQERDDYTGWEAKGRKTLSDRVRAKVLRILETHQPAPIPPEAMQAMRRIVEEADQKYA